MALSILLIALVTLLKSKPNALRALGFDFKRVTNAISNIDSATITLKD